MEVNLDREINNFDGSKLREITVKAILLQYLGTFSHNDGAKMIRAYKLGQLVFDGSGNMSFDDKDVEIIREALKKPQHIAIVYAQICDIFGVNGENKDGEI